MDPNLPQQPIPSSVPPQPVTPVSQPVTAPQSVNPPAPAQPPVPQIPPKKPKSALSTLLILFLILFVGIGGFFGYQKFVVKETPPEPTPVATIAPTPTTDPTTDWKTYTNTIHGISFKYPVTWIIDQSKENTDPNGSVKLSKDTAKITILLNMDGIGGLGRDYIGSPTTFAGLNLFKYEAETTYAAEESFKGTRTIGITESLTKSLGFFRYNNKTYSITLSYPIADHQKEIIIEAQKEFDQILSTFKFTNQEDETATWKEHKAIDLGLVFKAPPNMNVDISGSVITIQDYPLNAPPPEVFYKTLITVSEGQTGTVETTPSTTENKALTEKILATFVFSE